MEVEGTVVATLSAPTIAPEYAVKEDAPQQLLANPPTLPTDEDSVVKVEEAQTDAQAAAAQAVGYSMVQTGQLSDNEYAMMNAQQLQPYPTGMLPAVPQPSTYSMGTPSTAWMMDNMGRPAAEIPPASALYNGNHINRALTLGYGSQTTTFYQVPQYSAEGIGFMYGNTWEGEEVDESTPPGKHGTYIVTPDHRQFHILASISDSRVGQLHLLNPGDTDPSTAMKVIQNTIPNHYRSAVQYIHKIFVCEFVDKKFSVRACEPGAPKFYGTTSTLAWTSALKFYCPQRTSCRLSGPLYFGFAIPAVQELCPGLRYVARKSGNRGMSSMRQEPQYADSMTPMSTDPAALVGAPGVQLQGMGDVPVSSMTVAQVSLPPQQSQQPPRLPDDGTVKDPAVAALMDESLSLRMPTTTEDSEAILLSERARLLGHAQPQKRK